MSFAVVVLLARIALVLVLYLFLMMVVRAVYRDLRSASGTRARPTPGNSATGVPRLVVLAVGQTPYQVGQEFRLRAATLLGRDRASDIVVEDDFVSAQHLRLFNSGGDWMAQDLNSTNGTRINSARLQDTAPLKSGDILDLGRLRLRFTVEQ